MLKPKKRRRRKGVIALILLLLIGGAATFATLRKKEELITVQVDKVTRRDVTETVVANGRIQPVTQVLISPEVAGEIVDLPVVEGQQVKKGDLLLQIKPENYQAGRNSAEASYKFSLGSRSQAEAELEKSASDFKRNEELFKNRLISANVFMEFKTNYEVAKLRLANSLHQMDQARFALDKATDDLTKTTITSPIDGTVTKLKSQLGERVLGTSFNMGTEMMTIAKLDQMDARVDIGEIDIVLIEVGQTVRLEVDAFKDRKFKGTVSAIANASKSSSQTQSLSSSQQQEAPKFEVKIRVLDQEAFRPGMSVTAEIETRSRKGVLTVPIQAVTTRLPLPGEAAAPKAAADGKVAEGIKPTEVVFGLEGDHVKRLPVKTGISDSDYFEIISGLNEGQQIVSGGYKAISKDLEDGRKVKVGADAPKDPKDAK
ncbi:MAG TPA: efflux RND transporter periplasmic adaptor subunit [Chthoniobacteraceae bacterium]|jgi:HlyD family secretion protein|nr:efflux RND transporter periplasmic adaptor subunit [Chthoniobacteraceae bacterium]